MAYSFVDEENTASPKKKLNYIFMLQNIFKINLSLIKNWNIKINLKTLVSPRMKNLNSHLSNVFCVIENDGTLLCFGAQTHELMGFKRGKKRRTLWVLIICGLSRQLCNRRSSKIFFPPVFFSFSQCLIFIYSIIS